MIIIQIFILGSNKCDSKVAGKDLETLNGLSALVLIAPKRNSYYINQYIYSITSRQLFQIKPGKKLLVKMMAIWDIFDEEFTSTLSFNEENTNNSIEIFNTQYMYINQTQYWKYPQYHFDKDHYLLGQFVISPTSVESFIESAKYRFKWVNEFNMQNNNGNSSYRIQLSVDHGTKYNCSLDPFNYDNGCRKMIMVKNIDVFEMNETDEFRIDYPGEKEKFRDEMNWVTRKEIELGLKYIPDESMKLIWHDEFDEDHLDNTKWTLINIREPWYRISRETNCSDYFEATNNSTLYKLSNGTLKFHKARSFKDVETFSLITLQRFRNVRIEIRAKIEFQGRYESKATFTLINNTNNCFESLIYNNFLMKTSRGGYYLGYDANSGVDYNSSESSQISYLCKDNFEQFHIFGIEYNDIYVKIFFNDQILYQANRFIDQAGTKLYQAQSVQTLPFNNPLYLSINTIDWKNSEIDWVRIYAHSNDSIHREIDKDDKVNNTGWLIYLIASIVCVVCIFIILTILIIRRKIMKKDIGDNIYELYNYDTVENEYEDTNYKREYIEIIHDENIGEKKTEDDGYIPMKNDQIVD